MQIKRSIQLACFWIAAFAISSLCIAATKKTGMIATVWPLDPMALAMSVRWAKGRRDQAMLLGGYGVALGLADLVTGSPLALALTFPIANIAGVCVAVWFLRRGGAELNSPKAFANFLFGPVLLTPLVSAALAVAAAWAFEPGANLRALMVSWSFALSVGMATLAPFLLSLKISMGGPSRTRRQLGTLAGAIVMVTAVSAAIFLAPQWPPLFMIFPVLVLAALADRELGGVAAVLIAAGFVVYGTAIGVGPASIADRVGVDRVVFSQLLLMVMACSVLPITGLLRKLEFYARELDQRRAEAESLSQARSKLLAYVSHEIRSPLAGVTTLAQLLRDGQFGELTPMQQETLNQIASSGAEVDALAGDLIDTAALQLGRASVSIAAVEVAPAVRSAIAAVQVRAAEYGATILFREDIAEGLVAAADPQRLRQILVNLLINGAKYGGRPPVVRVGVSVVRGKIRFEVSDNGKGLPQEKREALFGDFQRLGAEKTDIAGTGLGLALSREIARLQDGALGVEDGDLGGLRFWLELPLWQEAPAVCPPLKLVAARA